MACVCLLMVSVISIIVAKSYGLEANFANSFRQTGGRVLILENGKLVQLNLDQLSRSSIESTNTLLYGKIDVKIKLPAGDSAGILTSLYLSTEGSQPYEEIGVSFFRSSSGKPFTFQTNVLTQGKDRIQQFSLWFDPSTNYQTYSILWNPKNIVFSVNAFPLRVFRNMESSGVAYPKRQMRIHIGLRKGVVGTVEPNWSKGPFSAFFQNCDISTGGNEPWFQKEVQPSSISALRKRYMTYDYCTDTTRFPQGPPPECK